MKYQDCEPALESYKIKIGDYIVLKIKTIKHTIEKQFKVTKVDSKKSYIEFKGSRYSKKFPRYYYRPFLPLEKKTKPDYVSPNEWYVRVNDHTKKMWVRDKY